MATSSKLAVFFFAGHAIADDVVGEVELEQPVSELAAVSNSCTSGNVGRLRELAPKCLDNCQGSCHAVDLALTAYLRGGQHGATQSVCSNQGAFECFVQSWHINDCRPLINKAASFGFHLPQTSSELHNQCHRRLEADDADEEHLELAAVTEEVVATTEAIDIDSSELVATQNACTTGNVGRLRAYAPSCIDNCQGSCSAVDRALTAYLHSGQNGAKHSVCSDRGAFECFVQSNHIGACNPLINKAASFGFHLPRNSHELHEQCHRRLAAEDEVVPQSVNLRGSVDEFAELFLP